MNPLWATTQHGNQKKQEEVIKHQPNNKQGMREMKMQKENRREKRRKMKNKYHNTLAYDRHI